MTIVYKTFETTRQAMTPQMITIMDNVRFARFGFMEFTHLYFMLRFLYIKLKKGNHCFPLLTKKENKGKVPSLW